MVVVHLTDESELKDNDSRSRKMELLPGSRLGHRRARLAILLVPGIIPAGIGMARQTPAPGLSSLS